MSLPNVLLMKCSDCRVASTCPRQGSSPLTTPGGKALLCRLIGGYGRHPVDPNILSEESKKIVEQNGPCLTIAEVPIFDEASELTTYAITKIFSQPILHARERMTEAELAAAQVKYRNG